MVDITNACNEEEESIEKQTTEIWIKVLILVFEALPQAVIAEFVLEVCPAKKFHWKWLLVSFAACSAWPSFCYMVSFCRYWCKHHKEKEMKCITALCIIGGFLAGITFGFGVSTIVRDIKSMCRAT